MQLSMSDEGMWIIGYGSLIFKPPPLYSFRIAGTLEGFVRRFWQSSTDHRGTEECPGRVVTLVSLEDLKHRSVFHDDLVMYELNDNHKEADMVTESLENLPVKNALQKVLQLKENDLQVWGVAYYIAPENVALVKEYLDVREQNGYTTHEVQFQARSKSTSEAGENGACENGGEEIQRGPEFRPVHLDTLRALPKSPEGHYIIQSMIYIGTISNSSFVGPEDIIETAKVIKISKGPSGDNYEYLWKLVGAVRGLANSKSRDHYLEDLMKLCEA